MDNFCWQHFGDKLEENVRCNIANLLLHVLLGISMVLASSASIELESSSARVTSTTFQKRSLQCLNGYFFLWSNLIFWDMMGCGIAHFGRKGSIKHQN